MRRVLAVAAVAVLAATGLGAPRAEAGPKHGIQKWAVLVGVNQYPGKTADNIGAVGDVADLHRLLVGNGFPQDHIIILTDKQATAANIRSAMKFLVDHATDDSFSVFHYSGHIKQMSGDRDRDGEVLDEYLWPYDGKFISDAELSHNMKQIRGWSWVDIAGCEGAGLADGLQAFNRIFTGASGETEKAYEHPEWGNSVFTGLMVDFGNLQGHADTNRDGRSTIQEMFAYTSRMAPHITSKQKRGRQHPVMLGGDGTDWFLDAPAPAPPPPPPRQQQPPPPSGGGGGGGVDGDDPTR